MTARARLLLAALAAASLAAGPATRPALRRPRRPGTTTATAPATTRVAAIVDADAVPLLDQLAKAYAGGPLQIEGDLTGEFDIAGRRRVYTLHVVGRTDGHNRFVHDAGEAGRIVGDGEHGFLYDQRRNAFASFDSPATRPAAAELEPALIDVLLDENPALLLSLTNDPAGVLKLAATRISVATQPASVPTSQPAAGLRLQEPAKVITLRIDPATGEIRSSDIDFTPLMAERHAVAVKAAHATLFYGPATRTAPTTEAFVWQPPPTATEFELHAQSMSMPIVPPTTRPR